MRCLVVLRDDRPLVEWGSTTRLTHDRARRRASSAAPDRVSTRPPGADRRARGPTNQSHAAASAQPHRQHRELAAHLERDERERRSPRSSSRRPSPASERTRQERQSANVGYASDLGEQERRRRRAPRCSIVAERGDRRRASARRGGARGSRPGSTAAAITTAFEVLDRRVGGCGRVDPPGRRDQVRVERLERPRLAAQRGVAGRRRSRARAAPTSSSSVKIVGVLPHGRLPEDDRAGRSARRRERHDRDEAIESIALAARDGGATRRHSAASRRRTTRGSRSISRRTNRQATSGVGARGDDRVEPLARRVGDRHEHDVRLVALRAARSSSCVPPTTGTPCSAPPPQPRVVVDEADDALARRLAQLAQQAAARAARADDQRPRCRSRSRSERDAARRSRARRTARPRSAPRRCSASITKNAREKSPKPSASSAT